METLRAKWNGARPVTRMRCFTATVSLSCVLIAANAVVCLAEPPGSTVTGRVMFHGAVPPPQQLDVKRDPEICGTTVSVQPLVVDGSSRGLRDAVVSIEGPKKPDLHGADGMVFLTNKDCAFQPRIGTIAVGKVLELRNDDPMLHNTHIRMGKRTFVNVAQVVGGRVIEKRMKDPGMLNVQCDKHTFMQGYMFVFDHPYYAVTDHSGEFRIPNVPPGLWQVVVWHEILGTIRKQVEVPERGDVSVTAHYPRR